MKANYKGSEVDVIRFNFASKMADIDLKGTDTTVPFLSLTDIKAEHGEPFYPVPPKPKTTRKKAVKYVWAQDKMTAVYYEIVSINLRKRTVRLQIPWISKTNKFHTHGPCQVVRPLNEVLFLSRNTKPSVKIEKKYGVSSTEKLTRIVLAGYAVHFSGLQIIAKNSLPEKKGTLTVVYQRIFGKRT